MASVMAIRRAGFLAARASMGPSGIEETAAPKRAAARKKILSLAARSHLPPFARSPSSVEGVFLKDRPYAREPLDAGRAEAVYGVVFLIERVVHLEFDRQILDLRFPRLVEH